MSQAPILIVDDNPSHLKLMQLVIASHADIRTANSAKQALEVLKDYQPQVILMDIQLPDMDGFALTRKLKADPKYHNIIIIAVTAYAMEGDKQKALEAGCDGYVTKPIDVETFPAIIDEYLSR